MKYSTLLLFLFIICSCTKDNTPPNTNIPPISSELWPLKVGNKWIYSFTTFNEDGTSNHVDTNDLKVEDSTQINGNTYYLINDSTFAARNIDPNSAEYINTFANTGTPFKNVDHDEIVTNRPYPTIDGVGKDVITVLGGTTKVNGHDCIRIQEDFITAANVLLHRNLSYLQPGVGIVKLEFWTKKRNSNDLYLESSEELQSYTLK